MSVERYLIRREAYRDFRGGGSRGFSPLGFIVLAALMVGFLGPEMAGWLLGIVLGLITVGFIVRNMPHAKPVAARTPAGVGADPGQSAAGVAVPAKVTCLCGSSTHETLGHPEAGPHSKTVEDRFQSALAVELLAGRIKVSRRGGE